MAACFARIFMPYLVRFLIVMFLLWIMSSSVSVGEEGARSFGFLWSVVCVLSIVVVCLLFLFVSLLSQRFILLFVLT